MSKKLARKHREEYDSDDGFVEDAPKSKKLKSEPSERNKGVQKDDEGNEYWQLTDKRRVQVSQFKGNTMVGIREFYEQNGKMLPGKKGISMTVEQYSTFLELIPDIEKVLKSKGINVPRPQFSAQSGSKAEDEEASGDEDDEDEEVEYAEGLRSSKGKSDKDKTRRNHEATSDEDEDDE